MSIRSSSAFLLALLLGGCGGEPAAPPPVAPSSGPWTAEIRVFFTGCTSCAECRSAIRQISQTQSGSDHVEFRNGLSRITFPAPAMIRASEVANALADSRIIKGEVDHVELTLQGEASGDGRVFTVPATKQIWKLAEDGVKVPTGRPVTIRAALEGWRGKDAVPALKVQEVIGPQ